MLPSMPLCAQAQRAAAKLRLGHTRSDSGRNENEKKDGHRGCVRDRVCRQRAGAVWPGEFRLHRRTLGRGRRVLDQFPRRRADGDRRDQRQGRAARHARSSSSNTTRRPIRAPRARRCRRRSTRSPTWCSARSSPASSRSSMMLAAAGRDPAWSWAARRATSRSRATTFLFRTSFGQQVSMPKIANYIRDSVKAKNVAVVWVNNDFGKGGRDNFMKEMDARGIKVVGRYLDRVRPDRLRRRRREGRRPRTRRRSSSTPTRKRARAFCARRASRASTCR